MKVRIVPSVLSIAVVLSGFTASAEELEGLQPVNGTELFVKTMGQGEPIVIVHGGPGFDHSYFLPQMAELAQNYRLVFYDQRVSGRSSIEVDADEITLEHFVGDIEGLRELLAAERIHLMGHSFGGMLAMQYAIRHPERLASLLLINSTAASSEYVGQVNQLMAQRLSEADRQRQQELLRSEAFRQGDPDAVREFLLTLLSANFHDRERVSELNLYIPPDYLTRSERLQALAQDLTTYDIHDRLDVILCPTLIVRGDSEVLPEEATERVRSGIANSQLEVLENCGHFPFVECNDELQAVLREFLGSARARN